MPGLDEKASRDPPDLVVPGCRDPYCLDAVAVHAFANQLEVPSRGDASDVVVDLAEQGLVVYEGLFRPFRGRLAVLIGLVRSGHRRAGCARIDPGGDRKAPALVVRVTTALHLGSPHSQRSSSSPPCATSIPRMNRRVFVCRMSNVNRFASLYASSAERITCDPSTVLSRPTLQARPRREASWAAVRQQGGGRR